MIQLLGWVATLLVIVGYVLNIHKKLIHALVIWVVADILWVVYDSMIDNWSHAVLSTVLISINVYGYCKNKNKEINEEKRNIA